VIKREVWRTYRKGLGTGDPEYVRAARAAIESVSETLAEERRAS